MASNPWSKFFWNDWENDAQLKMCGAAAQGVWMRCLCLCAKADPKGFLLINGRQPSTVRLAKLFAMPEEVIIASLAELEEEGVFSRDRSGRIYCRRMVRAEKKARIARENGKKGGNPTLWPQTDIQSSDNPHSGNNHFTTKPSSPLQGDENARENGGDGSSQRELEQVLTPERAASVVAYRETIKRPLNAEGAKKLAEKFASWPDPNEAAAEMMAAGWTGFEPVWMENRVRPRGTGPPNGANGVTQGQRYMHAVDEVFDEIERRGSEEVVEGSAGRLAGPGCRH